MPDPKSYISDSIARPPYRDERQIEVYYVLVCLECGDPDDPLPMPFESAAARGKWATAHTKGTGHDRWLVKDQLK